MRNNEFDNLNYKEPNRTPLDDIAEWYEKNNSIKQRTPSDSVEAIRQRYDRDPNSLSPIELLTLGMANLDTRNKADSKKRQRAVNDYMQPYHEANKENEEYISTHSAEFEQLAKQITELQNTFKQLNGGDK